MNATVTYGGSPVEDKVRRRAGWRSRRGVVEILQYCYAIDRLQERGCVTELWVNHEGTFTLRWEDGKHAWHITASSRHIREQLEEISKLALLWMNAIDRHHNTASKYAVLENN